MTDINIFFENTREIECKDFQECFQYFDNDSIVTYINVENKYDIKDVKRLYDETNRPYCLIDLHKERRGDIMSHFKCNVEYTMLIGDIPRSTEYTPKRIISICVVYTEIHLKIYLDQPNMPDEIIFARRWYPLPTNMRRKIVNSISPPGIIDDMIYMQGFCEVRPNE